MTTDGQPNPFFVADSAVDLTRHRVEQLLSTPRLAELLAAYYAPDGPFAGHTFDEFGENPPDRIGNDDLLAVTMLDVGWKPLALRRLQDEQGTEINRLLAPVANDLDLWNASDQDLVAANDCWQALRQLPGIDWVIAGKTLARKRPRLIPIADSVTVAVFQAPTDHLWPTLRAVLRDGALRARIENARPANAPWATALRLLDTAVWMRHSRSTNARHARDRVGLPEA